MTSELNAFHLQQPGNQDIISSWLDSDDPYTSMFSQELQDIENHLLDFDTNSCSSLPLQSQFFPDLCNFEPEPQLQPNGNDQPILLPVEQCVESDVCDMFLNDNEFQLITPNDLRPDRNNHNSCDTINPSTDIVSQPTGVDIIGNNKSNDPGIVSQPTGVDIIEVNNSNDEVNEDENEDGIDDDPKRGTINCKNLVSERNRRRRLSKQLLLLRALVPNITKMDKRSVLVDALSYLRNIHDETERLQKELKEQEQFSKLSELKESSLDNPSGTLRIPPTSATATISIPKAQITEIDTEKIEDKRYAVKIKCKGGASVGSDVLRVFEALNFEITYTALQQLQPQEVLVTIFVRVRKQGKMTEDKLKDCITSMALKAGLSFCNP